MYLIRIVCPIIFLLLSCSNGQDERILNIDEILTRLHDEGTFNGNILIAEKGKILYEKSFGLSDIESDKKLSEESIFDIASISKTFTALSILQLEEKGLLSLTDRVEEYLPDFPYRGITIENLLSHTSGLYRIQSAMIREKIDQLGLTNTELLEVYYDVNPETYFQAGEGYKYANTNYILLALVIEKLADVSYETYIEENIFQKAKMSCTFLKKNRVPLTLQDNIVSYYRMSKWLSKEMEDISLLEDDLAEKQTFKNIYGQSDIHTTAHDLLQYHIALQDDSLIGSPSKLKMYTPFQLSNGENYVVNSKSNYPGSSGLSWRIAENTDHGNVVYHAGGFRGGRSFVIRNLSRDQVVIILTNNDLTNRHTFTMPMCILNNEEYMIDKKSLPKLFSIQYIENGIDSALEKYAELKSDENYIQFIDWDFEEIGEELTEGGDYLAAIELYKLYVAQYPEDEYSWSNLGDAYYGIKDFKNALVHFQKSLEINEKHQHAIQMIQNIESENHVTPR